MPVASRSSATSRPRSDRTAPHALAHSPRSRVRQPAHGKGIDVQLIRIAGPTAPMRRLSEVEGLHFERTSARRVGDDRWQVSGYASDDALATLRERGLEIEAVVESEELDEQRKALYSRLEAEQAREARE